MRFHARTALDCIVLAAVLTLIACGDPHFPVAPGKADIPPDLTKAEPSTLCNIRCLRGVLAGPGDVPNCRIVTGNMEMIVKLYGSTGISTEARACELLSEVTLFVRPEKDGWEAAPGRWAGGTYDARQITMVQNMVGLGHETLHAFEDLTGVMDPWDPHRGWEIKPGYTTFLDTAPRLVCSQVEIDNAGKPWCR
jgi:hypothetical protein